MSKLPRLAAATFIAACGIAAAEEPQQIYHLEGSQLFGRPTRIVEPVYPAEALAKHITGYVELRGKVAPLLSFEEVQYMPGTPEASIFIEPLKAVLPHWEFTPAFRDGCFPSDEPVAVRVNFEIEADKPKVSVTVARSERSAAPPIRSVHKEQPQYPLGAVREGVQAYVYTSVEVNRDGSVAKVDAKSYPHRTLQTDRAFERSAEQALAKWRFTPAAAGEPPTRILCYQLLFTIKD